MPTYESSSTSPSGNFRTLGVLWIVYGVMRLVGALLLFYFSATATLMYGALLNRVANPFAMMSDFHIVYAMIIILGAICGILGIIAGLGLMAGSGRGVALLAAVLSLCEIPFGLTLGTYTLVALLPARRSGV